MGCRHRATESINSNTLAKVKNKNFGSFSRTYLAYFNKHVTLRFFKQYYSTKEGAADNTLIHLLSLNPAIKMVLWSDLRIKEIPKEGDCAVDAVASTIFEKEDVQLYAKLLRQTAGGFLFDNR